MNTTKDHRATDAIKAARKRVGHGWELLGVDLREALVLREICLTIAANEDNAGYEKAAGLIERTLKALQNGEAPPWDGSAGTRIKPDAPPLAPFAPGPGVTVVSSENNVTYRWDSTAWTRLGAPVVDAPVADKHGRVL